MIRTRTQTWNMLWILFLMLTTIAISYSSIHAQDGTNVIFLPTVIDERDSATAPVETVALLAQLESAAQNEEYVWGHVPIGGGAYITGIEIHPQNSNLVYLRTDVGGVYRWDAAQDKLIQLLEKEISYPDHNLWGIESIALDRNNQNLLYIAAGTKSVGKSNILKSTDQGKNWTRINLSGVRMGSNAKGRWAGERLAVDPNNSNIIFFASRYDGLWRSDNAANSWDKHDHTNFGYDDSVGSQTRGLLSFVAFDPQSGNDGKSQIVYVGAFGKGVYRSKDGGETFSLLSKSPSQPERGVVVSDGTIYVTHSNGVSKFSKDKSDTDPWGNITPQGGQRAFSGMDVSPTSSQTLVVAEYKNKNSSVYRSTDGGANWTKTSKSDLDVSGGETWGSKENWANATADIAIDPNNSKKIWLTSWFGAWRTNDITASRSSWKPIVDGHEELVVHDMISPSTGANLISGVADYGGFRHIDPLNSAPDKNFVDAASHKRIQDTHSLDWAIDEHDKTVILRVGGRHWDNASQSGLGQISRDNGETWTAFEKYPYGGAKGGAIAISADGTDMVWLPYDDKPNDDSDIEKPYASSTMNVDWKESSGIETANLIHSRWAPKRILAADRQKDRQFYLLDYRKGRLYRSENGGVNWVKAGTLSISNSEWDPQTVKANPAKANDVWVSSKQSGLFHSDDKGNSFRKIDNVQNVASFGFGKAKPGTNNPTLYLYGKANSETTYGIYRSHDLGDTWINIMGDWTISNKPHTLVGDSQVYGRLYIGTGGNGVYYGQIKNAPPPPPLNIFEVGSVTAVQTTGQTWHSVSLQHSYTNPVVVMGVPSFNGPDPVTMRIRNVTNNRFEYQIDEWDYLDGGHIAETIAYMVMEARSGRAGER